MKLINPIKALTELFFPENRDKYKSPLKTLSENHPDKKYCYTFIGLNNKPLSVFSLLQLEQIKIKTGLGYWIILENQLLYHDISEAVKVAKTYGIQRIRKYSMIKKGIDWEGNTEDIYKHLMLEHLFKHAND